MLKELREASPYTQQSCADQFQIDLVTWQRYEVGARWPTSVKTEEAIAQFFGKPNGYFRGESEPVSPPPIEPAHVRGSRMLKRIFDLEPEREEEMIPYLSIVLKNIERQKIADRTKKRQSRIVPEVDEGGAPIGNSP